MMKQKCILKEVWCDHLNWNTVNNSELQNIINITNTIFFFNIFKNYIFSCDFCGNNDTLFSGLFDEKFKRIEM